MAKRYYERDGNLALLKDKTIAIIGYGSQGHAHALNLRDSGVNVVVGLYAGSASWPKAEAAGLRVLSTADAAKAADVIMILVADHIQGDLYKSRHRAAPDGGQDADVRARIQHSFRADPRTGKRGCVDDRPQSAGPSRPRTVHRGRRRARPGRR